MNRLHALPQISCSPSALPAEEAVGVEDGAGSREDVQEGMDGGGGVTQVQNHIHKILRQKRKEEHA